MVETNGQENWVDRFLVKNKRGGFGRGRISKDAHMGETF